jgi:membrane-associated phospholipid phosphatase
MLGLGFGDEDRRTSARSPRRELFGLHTFGFPTLDVGNTCCMPVVIVVVVALGAGLFTAALVARFPAADPAAPRVAPHAIANAAEKPAVSGFLRSRVDPEAVTGLLLTTALVIALGAAIAIGALFEMVQHNALLARFDLSAARFGAQHATPWSTHTLREVSVLGGTPMMIAVAVTVAIVEVVRTRRAAVIAFVATVVVGQVVLMNLTKWIVDRPRPHVHQLTGFSGSSFPSGHATFAAGTFAAAAFLIGRARPHRVKVVVASLAVAIAAGVATTRVMLGVHWLTDVLAGLALGWGWFALCSAAFGGRVLRFGQPVEVAERVADDAARV